MGMHEAAFSLDSGSSRFGLSLATMQSFAIPKHGQLLGKWCGTPHQWVQLTCRFAARHLPATLLHVTAGAGSHPAEPAGVGC